MTNANKQMIDNIIELNKSHGSIEIGKVFALYEMAKADIYPDGTFSDDECNIWSLFR